MDDQVAVPTDAELKSLLEQFVCVRMVQMWGVDLSRFQFDYAMTWAVFLQNADGTLYGRYGTRSALRERSAQQISLAGFKRSLEGALALHDQFGRDPAAVRAAVAGKQRAKPPEWRRPETIPTLAKNKLLAKRFTGLAETRNQRAHGVGCIHCHMVQTNELMSLRLAKSPIPERSIWPWPQTGAVGMQLDPKQRATVRRVRAESAAAKAGIEPGDEILRLEGQTILSPADVQWVLHNTESKGELGIEVRRGDGAMALTMSLAEGWRRRLGDWRFTNLGVCMQIAGFNGRPARAGASLAIRVQRVHRKRLAGVDLKQNDVIVAIDGRREAMNLGQLTQYLLSREPGSEIAITRTRPRQDGEATVRWKIN